MCYIGIFPRFYDKPTGIISNKRLFFIVLITEIVISTAADKYTYKDTNSYHTGFLYGITSNVLKVEIQMSTIPVIDCIEALQSLHVVIFPDFSNVSTTLKELKLKNNKLHEIKFIPPMSNLDFLDLS